MDVNMLPIAVVCNVAMLISHFQPTTTQFSESRLQNRRANCHLVMVGRKAINIHQLQ